MMKGRWGRVIIESHYSSIVNIIIIHKEIAEPI
jgi:hypothetical protein